MPSGLLLALALATPSHPGVRVTRGPVVATSKAQPHLTLELRLFHGTEEVSGQTRISLYRAGERGEPMAQLPSGSVQLEIGVPQGIYDVQAIRERDGRVLNIRWALRLVVMPYPDESGHHLEVINFQNGFGALQVSTRDKSPSMVSIYKMDDHEKEAASPVSGRDYVLFVLPAGSYDLRISAGKTTTWQNGIEVPLDRTRLWIVP
jgi:hypothetical protein